MNVFNRFVMLIEPTRSGLAHLFLNLIPVTNTCNLHLLLYVCLFATWAQRAGIQDPMGPNGPGDRRANIGRDTGPMDPNG